MRRERLLWPARNQTSSQEAAAPTTLLTCGLIGLPACGKSTLFALLTGTPDSQVLAASGEIRRVIKVPDPRVGTLAALFGPKKVTYAQIEIIDIPGLVPGARSRAA